MLASDDTSVSIVEKHPNNAATVHFLENVTADTRQYRGIHPIEALLSHQESLAKLVNKALGYLPPAEAQSSSDSLIVNDGRKIARRLPDFVAATRGPGMRSNLAVGIDTAKGLAVAWQRPFIGVHHMQAHLLTPRLVSALGGNGSSVQPEFPFLSILVSGGHSMLVHSRSLIEHEIIASTVDIAMGETLDKSAREILPESLLQDAKTTMYGKMLEKFAFPNGPADYADYRPPKNRGEEQIRRESPWGWSITTPFANTRYLQFSFSCISSTVSRIFQERAKAGRESMSNDERIALAREVMRVCFEHLASRTIIALETLKQKRLHGQSNDEEIKTLVVSGGVAANKFLMTALRSFLDVRGFEQVRIVAPPPYLCTDNAAMIGWAGIEMFEAGWSTDLNAKAVRRWTLDPQAEDGGILGIDGWIRR